MNMVLIAASTNKEIITVKECFKKEYRQEALATSQQLNCPPGKHMANVPCVFKFATSLFFRPIGSFIVTLLNAVFWVSYIFGDLFCAPFFPCGGN